jgi:hypothetical protein
MAMAAVVVVFFLGNAGKEEDGGVQAQEGGEPSLSDLGRVGFKRCFFVS